MRVVFDCRCVHPHMGGIGYTAWHLVQSLARQLPGESLNVLVGPQPIAPEVGTANLIRCPVGAFEAAFEQLQLPNVLAALNADIYINPAFSVPALKTTGAQVSYVHDVVFEEHPDWVEPRLREYLQVSARQACRLADHVVTVSDHALSRIREVYGIREDRVCRIYNGVADDQFARPRDQDIHAALQRTKVDRPYLLYVGPAEKKKGTPELLAAFEELVRTKAWPGVLVMIGGRGGGEYDLNGSLARLSCRDRVRPLGYVDELTKRGLLAGAAAMVYPSLYEGFGLPPLEAMAMGVPVVVHDGTSLPEVGGDIALRVDVRDTRAFAAAMFAAATDPLLRRRTEALGPSHARRFSWEDSARQLLAVCRSLMVAA